MMFGRFTERAQKVLALSQEEAVRLNHHNIGTEHILLGLVREGEGIAAKALEALGLKAENIQEEVGNLIGVGKQPMQTIHYTPRAKKVVELSQDEARKLGHSYVGTEHILLGLIREGEGVAARVLNNLGVSLNKARQQVLQLLGSCNTCCLALFKLTQQVLQLLGSSESQVSRQGRSQASSANTPTLDSLARDLTASV